MEIKFKEWARMSPDAVHPHKGKMPHASNWIKYDKGYYVIRPYQKYSTSKWHQSMLDFYEILLDPFKHLPIDLLEIGVYAGESLRYFREFFTHPDTKLVGADMHVPETYNGFPVGNDYILEIGNQSNPVFLQSLADKHGPFDVVLDDASHDVTITKNTFRQLWPHVKEGGFYLIEDMGYEDMRPLLDEVVTTKQGKGFISLNSRGFGPEAGAGGITVLKKTQDLITGLEEVLIDD